MSPRSQMVFKRLQRHSAGSMRPREAYEETPFLTTKRCQSGTKLTLNAHAHGFPKHGLATVFGAGGRPDLTNSWSGGRRRDALTGYTALWYTWVDNM